MKMAVEKNVENLNKTEEKGNSKLIIFTCLKTLLCLIVGVFYVFTTIFCLSPKTTLKINQVFGFRGVETACYERIYLQSGKLGDLYNLIEVSIKNKDNNRITKYVDEMKNSVGYAEYCEKLNLAAENVELKYYAYVGDYDSYIDGEYTLALFRQNQSKAEEYAIKILKNGNNILSFPLATYVDCLKEKNDLEKLKTVLIASADGQSETTVLDLIENQIAELDYSGKNTKTKLLYIYTLLKIEKCKYTCFDTSGDTTNASESLQKISDLQAEYNTIVNG